MIKILMKIGSLSLLNVNPIQEWYFNRVTTFNDLNDTVCSPVQDDKGNIYFGSYSGLYTVIPSPYSYDQPKVKKIFDHPCYSPTFDKNGDMYFSTYPKNNNEVGETGVWEKKPNDGFKLVYKINDSFSPVFDSNGNGYLIAKDDVKTKISLYISSKSNPNNFVKDDSFKLPAIYDGKTYANKPSIGYIGKNEYLTFGFWGGFYYSEIPLNYDPSNKKINFKMNIHEGNSNNSDIYYADSGSFNGNYLYVGGKNGLYVGVESSGGVLSFKNIANSISYIHSPTFHDNIMFVGGLYGECALKFEKDNYINSDNIIEINRNNDFKNSYPLSPKFFSLFINYGYDYTLCLTGSGYHLYWGSVL